jgi:sugar phosphate isomerase/epimerase
MKSAVTVSLVPEASGGPFVFWDDLDFAIQSAKELGFDGIEIFPPDSETLRSLNVAQRLQGFPVAAIGTGAGWVKHRLLLCDPDREQRQRAIEFVRSMMRMASELSAPAIVGSMQGRSTPTLPKAEARALLRDSLETLNDEARKLGQPLLFEPLNRYETDQANTLEQASVLTEELKGVLLLADLFHMNIEEANVAESIRHAGLKIGHVHFADSNRMAIGFGHLEVSSVVQSLRSIDYSGYLSAEVLSRPDAMGAAQQTIKSFHKYTSFI